MLLLIDFTKWKYDNITEDIQNKYSNSKHDQRLLMLNDIFTNLNLSNTYRIFRVLNIKLSILQLKAEQLDEYYSENTLVILLQTILLQFFGKRFLTCSVLT